MENYLNHLNEYYKQLNSGKKCKHCKENKDFKEKDGKLIFSCGSKNSKCPKGFTIELSKYINYNETLHNFQEFLKKNNTLGNSENINIKKDLENILRLGEKQLIKNNNLKLKKNLLQEYNELKIKTIIEQNKLMNDLNNKNYSGDVDKNELYKRYYTLNVNLNEKYKDIIDLYDSPVNNYIMISEGKIL